MALIAGAAILAFAVLSGLNAPHSLKSPATKVSKK